MQKAGESTRVFMCKCKVKLELYRMSTPSLGVLGLVDVFPSGFLLGICA